MTLVSHNRFSFKNTFDDTCSRALPPKYPRKHINKTLMPAEDKVSELGKISFDASAQKASNSPTLKPHHVSANRLPLTPISSNTLQATFSPPTGKDIVKSTEQSFRELSAYQKLCIHQLEQVCANTSNTSCTAKQLIILTEQTRHLENERCKINQRLLDGACSDEQRAKIALHDEYFNEWQAKIHWQANRILALEKVLRMKPVMPSQSHQTEQCEAKTTKNNIPVESLIKAEFKKKCEAAFQKLAHEDMKLAENKANEAFDKALKYMAGKTDGIIADLGDKAEVFIKSLFYSKLTQISYNIQHQFLSSLLDKLKMADQKGANINDLHSVYEQYAQANLLQPTLADALDYDKAYTLLPTDDIRLLQAQQRINLPSLILDQKCYLVSFKNDIATLLTKSTDQDKENRAMPLPLPKMYSQANLMHTGQPGSNTKA